MSALPLRGYGGTGPQSGFPEDAMHVVLHRGDGDHELGGDLLVAAAVGDQRGDLPFPRAGPHDHGRPNRHRRRGRRGDLGLRVADLRPADARTRPLYDSSREDRAARIHHDRSSGARALAWRGTRPSTSTSLDEALFADWLRQARELELAAAS